MFTIMRYLQYGTLQRLGLGQFDAWAATFGETQTAIELAPEASRSPKFKAGKALKDAVNKK